MLLRSLKISLLVIVFPLYANTSPTGQDLLEACAAVHARQASDTQTMLCIWYVTPCDCEQKDPTIPKVCLPNQIKEQDLINIIIKDLNRRKQLLNMDATFAANTVLQEYYPCVQDTQP